jgi:hypothetical protein
VVYFPKGGSVDLDVSSIKGQSSIEWCEMLEAKWLSKESARVNDTLELICPGDGHWIAMIKKQ